MVLALSPLLVINGALMARLTASSASQEQVAYGKAGGVAEEAMSLIRTVVAFAGEEREIRRYEQALDGTYRAHFCMKPVMRAPWC